METADAAEPYLADSEDPPSVEEVRETLRLFSPSASSLAVLERLVQDLGDDEYVTRERATEHLASCPVLPESVIHLGAESEDFEIRARMRRIVARRPAQYREKTLAEQLRVIAGARLPGLTADVLAALEGTEMFTLRKVAVQAIEATSTNADLDAIRQSLESDNPLVRVVAVDLLAARTSTQSLADIKTRLTDEDPRVKFAAAMICGDHKDRACLLAFAEMVSCDEREVRFKSQQALQAVSGKKHPDGIDPKKASPEKLSEAWIAWAGGPGQTEPLEFPIELPTGIDLLDDADLKRWELLISGRTIDLRAAKQFVHIEDGVLRCSRIRGNLLTREKYDNYRLTLQWRWPVAAPNVAAANMYDGGVLLMQSGPENREGDALEVQLHDRNAGDFYALGAFKAREIRTGVGSKLANCSEMPRGQWNRMEIVVHAGNVTVKINDVLQNKASGCPTEKARIGLRLEQSEAEFRDIQLMPID